MPLLLRAAALLRTLHWRRGLRAGFAVASAMLVCRLLGRPMGWAALGGFEAVLVDNGGPYRSRMQTIATIVFGGALCGLLGFLIPQNLLAGVLATAAVCFAITFARVASQPIASTSVIILVIYFAGFGSAEHTLAAALPNIAAYVLAGLWAAVLSLFLWPVDPFRPARLEVAAAYDLLASFTATIHPHPHLSPAEADADSTHTVDFKRQLRTRLESARAALAATPARATARTVRARNLAVLLETADMLFASTVRLTELAEALLAGSGPAIFADITRWLSEAERTIAHALQARPADDAASFGLEGSHRIQHVTRRAAILAAHAQRAPAAAPDSLLPYLVADERDELQNIEIAFEAVRAVWTGYEPDLGAPHIAGAPSMQSHRTGGTYPSQLTGEEATTPSAPVWLDAIRQNWTFHSVMMRHALRMAAVGAVDVLLMHSLQLAHGFWLAMTSIIVLQPYSTGTLRKSLQRVGGTIGGGVLAAGLTAIIHTNAGIIAVITVCSVLTLATYAVDYGWYSFFLTPTFVLMSLPYLQDWRFAGLRIVTTILGALTAVLAMRLLWPQSLTVELGPLLARATAAAAAYVRSVLNWWSTPAPERAATQRTILAPARRACGLASQDAEEALDRALLDPLPSQFHLGRRAVPATESALTFTTYTRRFTQCLTTLAAVGEPTPKTLARLNHLIARLDTIQAALTASSPHPPQPSPPRTLNHASAPSSDLAEQMLQRMERQAGVLERAATAIHEPSVEA